MGRIGRIGRIVLVVIVMAGALAGAATPWEKLPFRFQPLVQAGSVNLLANADLGKGLTGWETKGEVGVDTVEATRSLRLGAKGAKGVAAVSAGIEAKASTLYRLSFRYRLTSEAKLDYENSYPGLHGWLTARIEGGKTTGAVRIHERRRGLGWVAYETHLFTPQGTKRVDVSVAFNATQGAALLADVDLREAKVEATEGRELLAYEGASWAELPRHAEPAPPTDVTVFQRRNPDELFFYSAPRTDEIGRAIELAATPGEVAVSTLAVYTPRPLTGLRLAGSAMKTTDGAGLGAGVAWRAVQYHPRRKDYYGQGITWHWVADFFLSRPGGVNVVAKRTQVFWLTLAVPEGAKAGNYGGTVTVKATGLTDVTVPVRLRVYPFRLADVRDKTWAMYGDAARWAKMTDEQVMRELADLRAHGVRAIMPPGRGQPVWDGNNVVGWQFDPQTERAMPMILKAGIPGPFFVWFEWLPPVLAKKLGVPDEVMKGSPPKWPESVRLAFRDCAKAVKAEFERRRWGEPVFVGVDEPGYWKKGSPEQFQWEYSAADEAGISTYCTSSYLPSDPIGKYLKYHCYGGGVFDGPERSAEVLRLTREAGQTPWYYATGCYGGQVGNMVRNRYGSGFIFCRTGVDGIASWTFQRPRGNAFDDFTASPVGQACITYPDPEHPGENLDTPQWEGLRQGWLDYRYAATLARAIADAKKRELGGTKGNLGETAKEFAALLAEMEWGGDVFSDGTITNTRCDEWRGRIAALMCRLVGK